jgi:tRNA G46 methylase TrmB
VLIFHFLDKNFIGVDIKGDRLAAAGVVAQRENLNNVAYLRIMMQFIDDFFEENEVDEIWITFPDPRPKDRDEKKRLTHPNFLNKYQKVLKPDGILVTYCAQGQFKRNLKSLGFEVIPLPGPPGKREMTKGVK